MEKIGFKSLVFLLLLVFTWTLAEVICPEFSAVAAEKQQAISGQPELINSLLEKERFSPKGSEAELFIQNVMQEPHVPVDLELKVESFHETPLKPVKQEPAKPVKKWSIFSTSEEKAISKGEALYKVAVSDGLVTLNEAVQIALANNLQAFAAKKKIEVARAKLTEARRALFPTVQVAYEEVRGQVAGQVDDNLGAGGTVAGQRFFEGKNKKINISQPLFHGGELVLTVKQAEENLKFSEEEYKKVRNEAIHQIRTAYFGAVKQEYNLQYQISLLNEVGAIHKNIRQAYLAKLISEVDYLNVDSQANQVAFQVESAKNDLLSANLLLRQSLNLMPEEFLPINLRLNYVKIDPDFNELLQIALKTNPEFRMKEFAFQSAFYGVKMYEAKKLPKIDLKGSYGSLGEQFHDTRALRTNQAENDLGKEWSVLVEASMPLGPNSVEVTHKKNVYGPTVLSLTGSDELRRKYAFNLMDRFSDITDAKSAEAAYLQAQSELQTANHTLVSQLRDNYYSLKKAVLQMDTAVAKIKYQEKQTAAARYLVGLQEQPPSNLLESLIELSSHKFSLIQASVDYTLAISNLNLSTGDPNYFETES